MLNPSTVQLSDYNDQSLAALKLLNLDRFNLVQIVTDKGSIQAWYSENINIKSLSEHCFGNGQRSHHLVK